MTSVANWASRARQTKNRAVKQNIEQLFHLTALPPLRLKSVYRKYLTVESSILDLNKPIAGTTGTRIHDPKPVLQLMAQGAVGMPKKKHIDLSCFGVGNCVAISTFLHPTGGRGREETVCRPRVIWRFRGSVVQPSQLPGTRQIGRRG